MRGYGISGADAAETSGNQATVQGVTKDKKLCTMNFTAVGGNLLALSHSIVPDHACDT
jgi:hypothetical protein